MNGLTDDQWLDVWAVFEQCFPETARKATDEQRDAYRHVLQAERPEVAADAVRHHLRTQKWSTVKPSELAEAARAVRAQHQRDSADDGRFDAEQQEIRERMLAQRERLAADRAETANALAAHSDEVLAGHWRGIIAANPNLRWMAPAGPMATAASRCFVQASIDAGVNPARGAGLLVNDSRIGLRNTPVTVGPADLAEADEWISGAKRPSGPMAAAGPRAAAAGAQFAKRASLAKRARERENNEKRNAAVLLELKKLAVTRPGMAGMVRDAVAGGAA